MLRLLCTLLTLLLFLSGNATAVTAGGLWFVDGRPAFQVHQAVELLTAAVAQGLDPQDYNANALQRAIALADLAPPDELTAISLDLALTDAMTRYLSDLHSGRIDPQHIHHNFRLQNPDAFDAVAYLQAALVAQRLPEAAQEAAPRLPLYAHLREALVRYRGYVENPAWQQSLPLLPGGGRKLVPGEPYAGLALLAQRLTVLGDLVPGTAVPPNYEGLLVGAVQSFQRRHGLMADGMIGKATLTQLQVTPAARVRQIELMLERLRWTPLMEGPRMIVINIPEFVLRAYEVQDGRISVRQEMRVIVGKAMDKRTPLFDEGMRFIEFSPYWNVPPSIERAELVPRLRRDPAYFARGGFEFVAQDGHVERVLSASKLAAVLAGQWRIRQRPGSKNALGDIKFVFPNHDNIYLHHTPDTQLFGRDRRDFSHGCIRVEQPQALAEFALAGMPEWTPQRIQQAMTRGESSTVRLAEPVPVLIAYGTALVKDGQIYFFDDIYGLDRLLDVTLRQRARRGPLLH